MVRENKLVVRGGSGFRLGGGGHGDKLPWKTLVPTKMHMPFTLPLGWVPPSLFPTVYLVLYMCIYVYIYTYIGGSHFFLCLGLSFPDHNHSLFGILDVMWEPQTSLPLMGSHYFHRKISSKGGKL